MTVKIKHQVIRFFIALVWLINGFFAKVLGVVPRHQKIVAHILGSEFAKQITTIIGFLEILMAVWILSKIESKTSSIFQIVLILSMNLLEIAFVPELLLWGKFNFIFAILFVVLIYYNEFILTEKLNSES